MVKEKSRRSLEELYEGEPFGSFGRFLDYLVEHPKITEGYSKEFKEEIIKKCQEEIATNSFFRIRGFKKTVALTERFGLSKKQLNEVYAVELEQLLKNINRLSQDDCLYEIYYREAGDLAEKIGNLELAIKMYEQSEQYCDAARCLEKIGDENKALKYYLKVGDPMWGDGSLEDGLSLAKKLGDESTMLKFYKKLIKMWGFWKEPDADEGDTNYDSNDVKRAFGYYKEAGTLAAKLKKEKTAIKFYLRGLEDETIYYNANRVKKIFAEAKSQDLMEQLVKSVKRRFTKEAIEYLQKIAK